MYYYQQPAFNKNGEEKTVELNEYRDQPLRMKAYLKLKVNPRKGVISRNEVTEKKSLKSFRKIKIKKNRWSLANGFFFIIDY